MRNGRERWLLKLGDEYVGIYNFILTTLVKYDIFYDKRVFFFLGHGVSELFLGSRRYRQIGILNL